MKILLADDEKTLRVTLADALADAGHEVSAVADGTAALDALADAAFDCVVTDLKMPGAGGLDVLDRARASGAEAVVITGVGSVGSAVAAMKRGAFDYVQKPFPSEELLLILERVAQVRDLRSEVARLRRELDAGGARLPGFGAIVHRSRAMEQVLERARAAARTDAGVLLTEIGRASCRERV
jgi:DNA-binding NtrC family response regulator